MATTDIFAAFQSLNVLVIGDVMLDRYLTGRVGRISPEAPVPVVEWGNEEVRLGGAANVALNVSALGAKPFLCGVVGRDSDSSVFFQLMDNHDMSDRAIEASPHRPTTVKTRIIADNQHLLRLDREVQQDLHREERKVLSRRLLDLLDSVKVHVIILQDYNKGVLSKSFIQWILKEAKSREIPIAVDPKFRNFFSYSGVELFKPNLKEVRDALHQPVRIDAEALQAASTAIRAKLQNKYTLITLSEQGAFMEDGDSSCLLPTHPRTVADVCGAGDAVISVAAMALAIGLDKRKIVHLSNLAGGQVVEKVGVVPVDRTQLMQEWQRIFVS